MTDTKKHVQGVSVHVGEEWADAATREKVGEVGERVAALLAELTDFIANESGRNEAEEQVMSFLTSIFVSFACMFQIPPANAAAQLVEIIPQSMREHYARVNALLNVEGGPV